MSFKTKYDFFGLAGASSNLEIIASDEGKTASVANGYNEKGDVVASEMYGEQMAPSCSYLLKGAETISGKKLGGVITGTGEYSSKKFTLTSLTISTSRGAPTTIQASGSEIPSSSTTSDCTYSVPSLSLVACHHAQILMSAFSVTGDGCYLHSANYTIACNLTTATKDGSVIAYDVAEGKMTASVTIQQVGTTAPTLSVTAASGWVITSPLTCNNPDSDFPMWSATLEKGLAHDTVSAS